MLAMAASNEALRYVSFPTQVLGKSCKMVPVMAGSIVFTGKKYSFFEYLQVALITLGVSVFNFGGKKKKIGKPDEPFGLVPSASDRRAKPQRRPRRAARSVHGHSDRFGWPRTLRVWCDAWRARAHCGSAGPEAPGPPHFHRYHFTPLPRVSSTPAQASKQLAERRAAATTLAALPPAPRPDASPRRCCLQPRCAWIS